MRDKELWERVTKAQEGFHYDLVVCTGENGPHEVWHCHKDGTRVYAFEIAIGRYGIAVTGDIDPLTFRVARGIGFLAGNDIDYYIHSKLDHIFYNKTEPDEDKVHAYVAQEMLNWLYDRWEGIGDVPIPWGRYDCMHAEHLDEITCFYENHKLFDSEVWEFREEMLRIDPSDNTALYDYYETAHSYNGEFAMQFDKPAWSIMFSLYMVCYAARRILEAAHGERGNVGESVGAATA